MSPTKGGNSSARVAWLDRAPRGHELRQFLVIACSPRTGSRLLCDAMSDTGMAGEAQEYFTAQTLVLAHGKAGFPRNTLLGDLRELSGVVRGHRPTRVAWPSHDSARAYVQALVDCTTTPNGVLSTKMFSPQLDRFWLRAGLDPTDLGVPVRWVHLVRRDRVAQAVSHHIASATRRWASTMEARGEANYDLAELRRCFEMVEEWSDRWTAEFIARGIEPLTVVYEEMALDLTGSVDSVLGLLGEVRTNEVVPSQERLADERNAAWIERFVAEAPDLAERRWWNGGPPASGDGPVT